MTKTIRYQKIQKMQPREGVAYATSYVKQTLAQRKELVNHISQAMSEIVAVIDSNHEWYSFSQQPLKGFPTTRKVNRCLWEILEDMATEAQGAQKNGLPKDFALAPIERWNKLFADTDYEFELVQTFTNSNNFNEILDYDAAA
jgi:hypothetical protein